MFKQNTEISKMYCLLQLYLHTTVHDSRAHRLGLHTYKKANRNFDQQNLFGSLKSFSNLLLGEKILSPTHPPTHPYTTVLT